MIVTCERCTTQFQLDDSRVPEAGVRVRCSRCKHAFLVEPPAKNELEKIQRVARRALEESEEGPEITQDLPPSSVVDGEGAPGASAGPGLERDLADDDESDWTFNDSAAGAGSGGDPEALNAARSAVDALLAGSPGSGAAGAEEGLEATDEADALDLELDARGGAPASADDRLELDTAPAGDLGDLAAEEEASPFEAPPEIEAPPASAGRPEPAPPRVEAPPASSDASSEELGSPAEWDIFDEPPPPRAEAPPQPVVAERRAEPVEAPAPEVFDEPAEGGVWVPRLAAALGWAATAALCAIALGVGLAPRPPAAAQATPIDVAGLQVEEVEGRWLDNAPHGPLYVVSGWLRNRGPASAAGDRVALVLRDAAGRRVGEPVPLGPTVDRRLLREARLSAIRAAQADASPPGVVAPGRGFPFEAVVGRLPEGARRFDFDVAASPAPSDARRVRTSGASGAPPAADVAPARDPDA